MFPHLSETKISLPSLMVPWMTCLCISQDNVLFNLQISTQCNFSSRWYFHLLNTCTVGSTIPDVQIVIMAVTLYIPHIELQESTCLRLILVRVRREPEACASTCVTQVRQAAGPSSS